MILLTPDRSLRRDELSRIVAGIAAALRRRGLRRGDRALWVVRSSLEGTLALLGALAAGVVVVPANAGYQQAELDHVWCDSGAVLALIDDETAAVAAVVPPQARLRTALLLAEAQAPVDDAAARARAGVDGRDGRGGTDTSGALDDDGLDDDGLDDDDLALLIYTSGTTGRAKGCAHTRGGLRRGLQALMGLWGIGAGDVVVHALPLFHVHGLCVALLGPLWAGAAVRLLPRFAPEAVVEAVAAGGTVFMGVPTMVHRLIAHLDERPADGDVLGRLRLFTCGSAALSAAQLQDLRQRTGQTILERYGMSETLITLSNRLDDRRPGAVGWPVPGVEARVVDDELLVRGPGVMRGYWNRPDADRDVFVDDDAGGGRWLRTGDVVACDDDGCFRIVGRASQDILKVGGYKLSTREIEEAIAAHPDVAEVAVVGVPDAEWGERVCAVVVPRAGATPTLPALQAVVALHEAKKPRLLLLRDALPRNALGKVLKTELKAWAAQQMPRP